MPTYTETQIRAAIETVINANTTGAVVFPWWVLGDDPNMWPGLLRSAADGDRVHGYVITRRRIDATETVFDRKSPQCADTDLDYAIWGFHFYDTGNRTANTDLTFNAELDAIRNAFTVLNTLPAELQRAGMPQFDVDLDIFGGELLHYATGRLVVRQL